MTDDLQAIMDQFAICEVMARFCRTLDTKDWEGLADTLAENGAGAKFRAARAGMGAAFAQRKSAQCLKRPLARQR